MWLLKKRLLFFFFVYPVLTFFTLLDKENKFLNFFKLNNKRILLRHGKIKLILFYRDLETYKEIYEDNVYDFFDLKRNWIVIDCGANIGCYTLKVAKKVGKVISIEPHPHNFYVLLQNLKINKNKNVVPLNLAAYDKEGLIEIYGDGPTSSIFRISNLERSTRVMSMTLDSITKKMKRIDLLKIDVEGAEIKVLRGATRTLRKTRNLILEVHPFLIDDKKIWEMLARYRFYLKKYSHPDPLISEKTYIIIGKKLGRR